MFSRLAWAQDDQRGRESGFGERIECRSRVTPAYVGVGDDRAALAKLEPGTLLAQSREQARANLDGIAAIAERNVDRAHGGSIRSGKVVSKHWRNAGTVGAWR